MRSQNTETLRPRLLFWHQNGLECLSHAQTGSVAGPSCWHCGRSSSTIQQTLIPCTARLSWSVCNLNVYLERLARYPFQEDFKQDAMMECPTKRRILCVSEGPDISSCKRLGRDQNAAVKASAAATIETPMVLVWLLIVISVAFMGKASRVWRFSGIWQVTSACTPSGVS